MTLLSVYVLYCMYVCIWQCCIDIYTSCKCDTQLMWEYQNDVFSDLAMPTINTSEMKRNYCRKSVYCHLGQYSIVQAMNYLYQLITFSIDTWIVSLLTDKHGQIPFSNHTNAIQLIYLLICKQVFSQLHIHKFIGQNKHLWEFCIDF